MKRTLLLLILSIIFIATTGCTIKTDISLGKYYALKTDDYQGDLTFMPTKEGNPYIEIKEDNKIVVSKGLNISYSYTGNYEYNGKTLFYKHDEGSITLTYSNSQFEVISTTGTFQVFNGLIFLIDK